MTITYITNCGYLIEAVNCTILIDYVGGKIPPLREDKPLYVLSSHSDRNHFGGRIFRLFDEYRDVYYFLSHGISEKAVPPAVRGVTTFVHPAQEFKLARFRLKAYEGTEGGLGFFMEVGAFTVLHAGALNDSSHDGMEADEMRRVKRKFRREVDSLPSSCDIAILPFNPALGSHIWDGPRAILDHLEVTSLLAMQFDDDYSLIARSAEVLGHDVLPLRKKGQRFDF